MAKNIFGTVCGFAVLFFSFIALFPSQAKATDASTLLASYSGGISNALNDDQTSKVAQALNYYAIQASGECQPYPDPSSATGYSGGCTVQNGKYYKTVVDKGPPGTAYYDWKYTKEEVTADIADPTTKAYLQNYFKCPPSQGCPGNAFYGNFDAFVMGNKFTASQATEMVAWIYGENMATSYAENLASQGIKGTDNLSKKIWNGGKPGGLQTFYGVLDKADNMGAMMEDQMVNGIKDTVKTDVKSLLAKAGVASADQLNLMSTAELSKLAKGALGVDMAALEKSAIGKLSDKIGFDVNNLSSASKDQLKALGVSDLAFQQFEAGGLNNFKNLAMYGLEGSDQMWNFDTNALLDTVGVDMTDLTSIATDELEQDLGVEDLASLDGLEGDDLISAVGGDTSFDGVGGTSLDNTDTSFDDGVASNFDDYSDWGGDTGGDEDGGGADFNTDGNYDWQIF